MAERFTDDVRNGIITSNDKPPDNILKSPSDLIEDEDAKKFVESNDNSGIIDTHLLLNPPIHHGFNLHFKLAAEEESADHVKGLKIMEPQQLFNIIMGEDNHNPCISGPNYLLLLDARRRETYDESHIELAKFCIKTSANQYAVPYGVEIETKRYVVVYDNITDILKLENKKVKTDAIVMARLLYTAGARHPVHILRGGYIQFSKMYPFLRTTKMMYMPSELDEFSTYPLSVLPLKLYLGTRTHGTDSRIQLHLKLTGVINCCKDARSATSAPRPTNDNEKYQHFYFGRPPLAPIDVEILHLPPRRHQDGRSLSLEEIRKAVSFIEAHDVVLVYSTMSMSRAAALCIAYLMYRTNSTLKIVLEYCQQYNIAALPNQRLLESLCLYEEELFNQEELFNREKTVLRL